MEHKKIKTQEYEQLTDAEDQKRLEGLAEYLTQYINDHYPDFAVVVSIAPRKNLQGDGQGIPVVFGVSPGTPQEIFMMLNVVHDKSCTMLSQFETDPKHNTEGNA